MFPLGTSPSLARRPTTPGTAMSAGTMFRVSEVLLGRLGCHELVMRARASYSRLCKSHHIERGGHDVVAQYGAHTRETPTHKFVCPGVGDVAFFRA